MQMADHLGWDIKPSGSTEQIPFGMSTRIWGSRCDPQPYEKGPWSDHPTSAPLILTWMYLVGRLFQDHRQKMTPAHEPNTGGLAFTLWLVASHALQAQQGLPFCFTVQPNSFATFGYSMGIFGFLAFALKDAKGIGACGSGSRHRQPLNLGL